MQTTKLFTEFDLDPALLQGLADMGYTHPTPVQEKAIPAVATGKDLMVQARTGTGKTLAFGLPTLNRIDRISPDTQVLVILPTRELAVQVADELSRVAAPLQIIVAAVFGGVKLIDQVDEMQWAPVVVGTPGRLRDHIERGYLHLDTCKVVVLDEADEMLDMGFKDDLEFILGKVPKAQRQTLLFSATFPPEIEKIAHKYMREPEKIQVSSGYTAATGLSHKFARVPKDKKIQALATLLRQDGVTSAIIFCDTKVETSWVFQRLKREGFSIGMLTGDVPQEKRLQTLQAFRDGELNLLVATDVAARGLDIPAVSHVYHFTVPRDTATYIHRSGRTARAGKSGISFTLVTPEEERDFQRIMREIKQGQGPQGQAQPQGRREEPRREEGRREEGRREREEGRREREEGGRREERQPVGAREGRREEGRREREEGRREEPRREGRREEGRREEGRREEGRREEGRREREEGRNGRGRDRGRGRFGRDRFAPEPLPTRPEPDAVSHVIDALGGAELDEQVSLAEYLIGRADAVWLMAALLAKQPQAVDQLENAIEALSSGVSAPQAAPAAAAAAPREERREEGRNGRNRRRRGGRGGERRGAEYAEAEATATVVAPEPAPAPAPVAPAAPVEAPAAEKPKRAPRRTKAAAAAEVEAPAPAPVAPAAPVEEAPAEKPKRATTRKTTTTRKKAAEAPAEAPAPAAEAPAEKPKRATTRKTTTRKKATTEEA